MKGTCPYLCNNKTEYGYCRSTVCINPKRAEIDDDKLHLEREQAYMQGWEDGRKALREEIWEDGRDRLD